MRIAKTLAFLTSILLWPALSGAKPQQVITDFLQQAQVAEPLVVEGLRLYPLLLSQEQEAKDNFMVTDVAMKKRLIAVGEHRGGTVETLRLKKKKSGKKVFLFGGEILSGAKQDRILAQDVLLPVDTGDYLLKVYCVEQGRWVMKSRQFETQGVIGTAKLRKTVAKKGGQGQVWGEVDAKSRAMNVNSPTQAMMANFNSPKNRKRIRQAKKILSQQMATLFQGEQRVIGVVATVRGEIISLDAFRSQHLMQSLWPKLVKAYALDAIDPTFKKGEVGKQDVLLFMQSVSEAEIKPVANPGIGTELAIESVWASGTAHLLANEVNHINLFPEYAKFKKRVFRNGAPGAGGTSRRGVDGSRSNGPGPSTKGIKKKNKKKKDGFLRGAKPQNTVNRSGSGKGTIPPSSGDSAPTRTETKGTK